MAKKVGTKEADLLVTNPQVTSSKLEKPQTRNKALLRWIELANFYQRRTRNSSKRGRKKENTLDLSVESVDEFWTELVKTKLWNEFLLDLYKTRDRYEHFVQIGLKRVGNLNLPKPPYHIGHLPTPVHELARQVAEWFKHFAESEVQGDYYVGLALRPRTDVIDGKTVAARLDPYQVFEKAFDGAEIARIRRCPVCSDFYYQPRNDRNACTKACRDTYRMRLMRKRKAAEKRRKKRALNRQLKDAAKASLSSS
jgi:hypothetical protein